MRNSEDRAFLVAKGLACSFWKFGNFVQHVFMEHNQEADSLANLRAMDMIIVTIDLTAIREMREHS